jgi:hypothetical protein
MLEGLKANGSTEIHVMSCDVSSEASVLRMLSDVRALRDVGEEGCGIDGIIHAAGVLRDAMIRGGGAASGFGDVWSSKAQGAYWLHKHTLQDNL